MKPVEDVVKDILLGKHLEESTDASSNIAAYKKVLKKWFYEPANDVPFTGGDKNKTNQVLLFRHRAGHSVTLTKHGTNGEDHYLAKHFSAHSGIEKGVGSAGELDHRIQGVHYHSL